MSDGQIAQHLFWKIWETRSCSEKEMIEELVSFGIPIEELDRVLNTQTGNENIATRMLNGEYPERTNLIDR